MAPSNIANPTPICTEAAEPIWDVAEPPATLVFAAAPAVVAAAPEVDAFVEPDEDPVELVDDPVLFEVVVAAAIISVQSLVTMVTSVVFPSEAVNVAWSVELQPEHIMRPVTAVGFVKTAQNAAGVELFTVVDPTPHSRMHAGKVLRSASISVCAPAAVVAYPVKPSANTKGARIATRVRRTCI
ncbi:hypothetical protein HDU82_004187 [Entophlyctis luteolus]|nr:hypothetical protein HDU82_004187 [Entophlyctis luteolus]